MVGDWRVGGGWLEGVVGGWRVWWVVGGCGGWLEGVVGGWRVWWDGGW